MEDDAPPPSGKAVSTGESRDGNPSSPPGENLWRRADPDPLNPSPSDTLWYQETIHYNVRKTGYYCVGMSLSCFYRARAHETVPYSRCPLDRPIFGYRGYGRWFNRRSISSKISRLRSIQKQVRWSTPSDGLPQSKLLSRLAFGVRSLCIRLGLVVLSARTGTAADSGTRNIQWCQFEIPLI